MAEAHVPKAETPAPWAESVPEAGAMTVDDLLALDDDGWQYELVAGRLVRMPPGGLRASSLAMRLGARLEVFVEAHRLGVVTGADGTYDLSPTGTPPTKGTGLVPDVAFIRADHLPPHVAFDEDKAVPFAPEVAVEVASPSQYKPGMATKAQRYLVAGTRLVWIVWPKRRQIDVWRPGDTKPSQTLGVGVTLDGGHVLPGFTCPVAEIFA
jgi:Uma2 family endonuclease